MCELWKDVVGYEGLYQVSSLGNVRSLLTNRLLKPGLSHGYLHVALYDGHGLHTVKYVQVHRLVATAFLGYVPDKPIVNHKNGNKQDNRVANLEWCTYAYNNEHARLTGLNDTRRTVIGYTESAEIEYSSVNEAARALGKPGGHANILAAINGRYKQAYGYKWKYKEE